MDIVNTSSKKLTALIVDDEATNRIVLRKLLSRLNYKTFEATNGSEAIETFKQVSPDLIFMDVMMPVMNGHEATRQIKALSADDFVPIIFLTALTGGDELKKCIDAGGDDFLNKPYDMVALQSKVISMERIRQLYRHLKKLNIKLEKDEQFARNILCEAIFRKNERIESIKTWFKTTKQFNNDLLLTSYTPSNGLNILFGHFNLEGTASAVGALPTSEVFRSMTQKGYAPQDIIENINQKLYKLLPEHINLRAVFININQEANVMSYANFGLQDCYLLSKNKTDNCVNLVYSNNLLGQNRHLKHHTGFSNISINASNTLLLARSNTIGDGEHCLYSHAAYEAIVKSTEPNNCILETVKSTIKNSIEKSTTDNNFSLVEIPTTPDLTPSPVVSETNQTSQITQQTGNFDNKDAISFELTIQNSHLKNIDPIPTLLNFLNSVTDTENSQDRLFTVFTEFYANALDHGILGLDSELKSSPEGFYNFFVEKEKRLQSLQEGEIKIQLKLYKQDTQNWLQATFHDSGPGFNFQKVIKDELVHKNDFSGRGFLLLRNLCDNIEFIAPGNCVTATLSWDQEPPL